MKKVITKFALFLTATTVFISCSVERNAITRGGESGYGIQSGFASSHKAKQTKTMASQDVAAPEEAMPAATSVVSVPASVESTAAVSSNVSVAESKTIATKLHVAKRQGSVAPVKSLQTLAEKAVKKSPDAASDKNSGSKSWMVAVLLCFFLGGIGIHRFYLGYTLEGVLQLLTLGGLGIWTFIDFIRILMRDLQPKDGSYDD